jgi:hypothetical protein
LNSADCHLWIWLIATFEFGWLPPLNSADCHLSIQSADFHFLIQPSATLPGPRCL